MNPELLQEYLDDWDELETYRTLSGRSFDFGNGLINDDSTQSEDTYWKMMQWDIERAIDNLQYYKVSRKKKHKLNHYKRKQVDKNKLIKLSKTSSWNIYYNEEENRYIRCYYSGRKGFAKWCSDRAVRNSNNFPLKGAGYRKVFDYWYSIF